ncbi:MAG: glycosyltransferase family 4 protein [Herbinix sp.]|jgi:glycosyltransferase involved in cell wall biosynthesis|nr:glycosyltransferase family 4 protein [Herbinix sp.]
MKIAMIGHKHIPSREGGVEIVVEELSKRLVIKGDEVEVYNRMGKNRANVNLIQKEKQYYEGIRIITILTINKKSFDALIYSFLATIRAIFGRYDLIHYHAEGPSAMLIIPHLLKIRTIVTIHGLDWQRAKWGGLATKYLLLGEKIAAKYADEVIVLSMSAHDYFIKTYNRETHYIPNGVIDPLPIEADVIEKKYGLKRNDYCLFLARIVPEKGLHYLIEAYRNLNTDIKLVIAGGSSHSDDYFNKIKALVEQDNRIIMTGFVDGQEREELFSNCRAYILPSDIEGMPLSLLEAMSYARKCIVSNIAENLEVIKNNGYIFEKGNVVSLLHQLQRLLNIEDGSVDPGHYPNYDLSSFNWDNITDKHKKLYSNSR